MTLLIDRSERGKLLLTGPEAKEFLHGQVTQDIVSLTPGSGTYAAFLTPKGKMLGDLRVLDAGEAGLWLDTERVALQELFNMVRRYKLGRDVELHKRTLERGLLSLLGADARTVLAAALTDGELPGTDEHAHTRARIGGAWVRVIAADGGDLDVLCDTEDLPVVKSALLAAGATAGDEEAAEIVRVERGRPRYGADLDESVIPQEAGLNERAVSFTKGCYMGQETVARLHYRGNPNRWLAGLRLSALVPPGTDLTLGEKRVGAVSSPVVSATFGPIALAIVRREAQPGDTLTAGGETATVVELPFN